MSVEEFLQKVAWPGVQPSPLGKGEASTAQEPQSDQEDNILEASEPTPPEPFIFETDPVAATPQVTPKPSTVVLDMSSSQPESTAPAPDLPLPQVSSSGTLALDLKCHGLCIGSLTGSGFLFPCFLNSFIIIMSLVHFII